jgi:hypothetical protein
LPSQHERGFDQAEQKREIEPLGVRRVVDTDRDGLGHHSPRTFSRSDRRKFGAIERLGPDGDLNRPAGW